MTAVMAQVERRYSRKVGDSFRRDREHLALFEELAMHEDLDSSLVAMDSNIPLAFEALTHGENVMEMDARRSDYDWLVTIPKVPSSPTRVQPNVVTNDRILSSIKTSRSVSRAAELAAAPTRGNASPAKSPRPSLSITPSKSPRRAFTKPTKSPSITPATKASARTSSSPTLTRASSIPSSPGQQTSTDTLNKRPLLDQSCSISVGSPKTIVGGASPSARGNSSPVRNSTGSSPSSASIINIRGTSTARSGFVGGTSPSRDNIASRGISSTKSVSSTTNKMLSPTQRNIPKSVRKPHNFANDFPAEIPANLRTSSLLRGSRSLGSLISRSYDDPSNSRRQSASSVDFDSVRSSDATASRFMSYNPSGGGFKPSMTNSSIQSFNMSIYSNLHQKPHEVDGQPPHSVSPPCDDEEPEAICKGRSSKADYRNIAKRMQMGFALKTEDVKLARSRGVVEVQSNRAELDSNTPRLTALVVSQGPVKIYQGLGDMEDIGGNWCCGMEYRYRSFCKHHECGIFKNFHDALVAPISKPAASKMNVEDGKDAETENVIVDSSIASVKSSEEMLSDGEKVVMPSANTVVKANIQQLKCRQEDENDSKLDSSISEDGLGEKKRPQGVSIQEEKGPLQTLPSSDPSEIIMLSPVSVCESETSKDALPLDDLAPASPSPGAKKNVKPNVAIEDFNWELDTLESPSRPLKSPDFFQLSQRHGEVAISKVHSFNVSEYDDEETESTDCNVTDSSTASHFHAAATNVHPSNGDSDDAHANHIVAAEDRELGPKSKLDRAMDRGNAQAVEGENVQEKGAPEEDTPRVLADDSNVSIPERSPIIPQEPGKLLPLVKSPKDGGYYKRNVSMISSKSSGVSEVSSTSATSIDLTSSVDTNCSAQSEYDNAPWGDPNYSGRFGDPSVGIPYKSIATLPVPLPVEVRCMESPGKVPAEGETTPDSSDVKTPRYHDNGLESKFVGFVRSASFNARKQGVVPSCEENSKMHSRKNSLDYFVDFLDSHPDLNLDGCDLTDALVSAHREAKKLENSTRANNNLRFIKRLDSKLSNNSLISDKSFESRTTDMSSDSSWESGKNGSQPLDAASCQVTEQIVENANALSHGRHLSSFKFGQKKTSAELELGLVSPAESDYGPSPARNEHSKELDNPTSDSSSQKSAKHYDEQLADGHDLPALKSTPGIVIKSDKTAEDPKFSVNNPTRASTTDAGEHDGNLRKAVQIMEKEQELEAELTPPQFEFAIRDFTPACAPSRTPACTPSCASEASSHDSHHSLHSHHSEHPSHCSGVTSSLSVASKASSKYVDSDVGEQHHTDFTMRQSQRSYCGCNIL